MYIVEYVLFYATFTWLSSDWTLRGDSENVLKDSKFMKSFDIKLYGTLAITPIGNNAASAGIVVDVVYIVVCILVHIVVYIVVHIVVYIVLYSSI